MGVALWLAGWQGSGLNEPGPARERGYLGSSHAFPSPSSVRPSRSQTCCGCTKISSLWRKKTE